MNNQIIFKMAGELMLDLLINEAIATGAPRSILPTPPRTRRGTDLSESNLIRLKRMRVEFTKDSANIILPAYVTYIESGRRPAGNLTSNAPEAQGALGFNEFQNRLPPIGVILEWMRQKGINSGRNNSVAFAIRNAIAQRGIKARPFINAAITKQLTSAPGQIADELFEQIDNQINLIFK